MSLAAPTSLTATASGTTQIDLAWTDGDAYDDVQVERRIGGGSWSWIWEAGVGEESYSDTNIVINYEYHYRVYGTTDDPRESSQHSNTVRCGCWVDTITDEMKVSESVTDYGTGSDVSDTITDTMYASDFIVDATDIITNYVYYLGTATGGIYEYGGSYKSDGGTAITAQWESKDTDFAEQSIENADKFKTVEFVRLHFIDKSAGALINVKVSTDGGANWTTETKTIGTGDNKGKTKDFHFPKTGQIFRFAVRSVSTSDDFQWTGLEAFYTVGGDYFEAS